MFRFENHMPNYWLNESRDFQLLVRLNDILFMGQRSDIATIQNLNDNKKCKNTFLNLLAKKVGFFTDKDIEENVLRNIIGSFKSAIKYKGTKKGIIYAVTAILKAENTTDIPRVEIDNTDKFEITIYTPVNIQNKEALKEFLKYIVPAGFKINIYSYAADRPVINTQLNNIDTILAANLNIRTLSKIRPQSGANNYEYPVPADLSKDSVLDYMKQNYAGSLNAGIIASLADLTTKTQEEKAISNVSNNDLNSGINIGE